jgi:putative DNA primase/helicase
MREKRNSAGRHAAGSGHPSTQAPTLAGIARALGGEVHGREVLAPGLGHSAKDRSLSVTLSPTAPDGFLIHSFAGDDWRDCRDHVRERIGLPVYRQERPQKSAPGSHHGAPGHRDSGEPAKAATQPPDNARKAAWLWGAREPITEGCPAGLYLRRGRRFDGPIPPTLGYLPPNSKYPPGMIAAFGFCEEPEPGVIDPPANVTGVHLTRLTPDGGKAPIDPVKIMLGPSAGLPIVLAPANDLLAIDIAEGIEKGLLIQADTGAGMWAAGSAGNMPKIAAILPPMLSA